MLFIRGPESRNAMTPPDIDRPLEVQPLGRTFAEVLSFGPHCLIPAKRLLLRSGKALDVGSRALDVLIALVESAGEVVGRRELMLRGWPDVVVGDGSLRVAVGVLRKALCDGHDGKRYIANVAGRGYCFVAHVDRPTAQSFESTSLSVACEARPVTKHKLPARLTRMVGRNETVAALSMSLVARRFVSVVGPGGMGKTTVAVSVAHALLGEFGDAVYFVDLGTITDETLVASTVAAALGVFGQTQDPLPGLMAFLEGRRLLLVLDSCEHLIEAVASLTECLYREAPRVHILATSRESLRVEGEHVHFLMPLGCPSESEELTAAEALATPAVQLFMERAAASGHTPGLTDAEAPIVAAICGRLDGMALAVELAGSRVGAYGLEGTANLLSNRFELLWKGRRTAPPRHQTMAAMLDWSFDLLCDRDRRVLRRLSTFVGAFTLDAAQAVAADGQLETMDVAEAIASLVNKSLIWVVSIDGVAHFRLLDPTRAYAAEKLAQTTEPNAAARQHARHYALGLSCCSGKGVAIRTEDVAFAAPYVGNIRAALEWSFSAAGEAAIGVTLAAAAAPLFYDLSLFIECLRWCELGLAALPESDEGSAVHLTLQSFLAASVMLTRGNSGEVRKAIEAALTLADTRSDREYQTHLLVGLNVFLTRIGDFRGALILAQRVMANTQAIGSPGALAEGESALGVAYHFIGDQVAARRHCERGLMEAQAAGTNRLAYFGFDQEIRALSQLARCHWLMGFPDRAAETARLAIDVAAARDHPVNLCMALIFTATVFLWRGDLAEAERLIRRLIAHAARHSLGPYRAVGMALKGVLSVAGGNPVEGVAHLRVALGVLRAANHNALLPAFHVGLAEGLVKAGEIDEAAAVVDAGLALSEAFGETLNVPDLLRVRGEICLQTAPADPAAAEWAFQLSLQLAKEQSALSLELRAAMKLSQLWAGQGKLSAAAGLLETTIRRFTEGLETSDLKLAGQLLADLTTFNIGPTHASTSDSNRVRSWSRSSALPKIARGRG
jgi:predicted ATPase/DNA-binding winged helix-turn-helix (wHTH) protein